MKNVRASNAVGSGAADDGRRWVVLLSPGGAAPSPLLAGLDRRGARVVVVDHPEAVMLELATGPRHAVVVHESQRVEHLNELLAAIATYYPSVVCWRYDLSSPNGAPRLAKTHGGSIENGSSCDQGSEQPRETVKPVVPQTDSSQDVHTRRSAMRASIAQAHEDPLLTQDELNMLLGDSDPDDNAAKKEHPENS